MALLLGTNSANHTSSCALDGGCVSDYVAVSITGIVIIFITWGTCIIFLKRNSLEIKAKHAPLLILQSLACGFYILSLLMSRTMFKLSRHNFWQSCYLWQLWLEGPLGFGFLMSCHIARAYRLCYIFVGRHLPPLKPYQVLLLLLLPWVLVATVIQSRKGLRNDPNCGASYRWYILISTLHVLYTALLVVSMWKLRSIPFKFGEFKDLLKGLIAFFAFLGIWAALFAAQKIDGGRRKSKTPNGVLVVTTRFILIVMGNAFILSLFIIPVLDPFRHLLIRKRRKYTNFDTMGQVLKVPPSGILKLPTSDFSFDQPLESLLHHKQFRQCFLAFADSRLAGENVHFFYEVRELNKILANNTVQRIYMAEHIIESYIKSGSPMEINISHQMRSEILGTKDLADPSLFKSAVKEALKMMEQNLLKDYWQSTFFLQLKEEIKTEAQTEYVNPLEQEIFSRKHYDPMLFSDNPFDQVVPYSGELKVTGTQEVTSRNNESARRFCAEVLRTSNARHDFLSVNAREIDEGIIKTGSVNHCEPSCRQV